jgi:FtsH-binding integral membrane protein
VTTVTGCIADIGWRGGPVETMIPGVNQSVLLNVAVGVLVLALLLWRQLQPRRVREDGALRLTVILLAIGVVQAYPVLSKTSPSGIVLVLLAAGLVSGAVFGTLRAYTTKLWIQGEPGGNGDVWRQGTWLTLVLWIVAVGLHFGIDYLSQRQGAPAGLGSSTIVLYLAVTLGIQRFITQQRALRLRAAAV